MIKPYYDDGRGIVIYHGDSKNLTSISKWDSVITDPPYGVTQNPWDDLEVTIAVFDDLIRSFGLPLVCTCQNPSSAILICRYLKFFKWSDVWEKTRAKGFLNCRKMPMRQHEDILAFASGPMPFYPQIGKKPRQNIRPHSDTAQSSNYGKFSNQRERSIALDETYPRSIVTFCDAQNGNHPNEKPLNLMLYLVSSFSRSGETIFDPFCGSGTTLIAAKDLGRCAVGIDKDERHCEVAARRLSQEVLAL